MIAFATMSYSTGFILSHVLHMDSSFATVAAAFMLALCSNAYSRYSGAPPIIYIMAGLLMQVPGGLAVSTFFEVCSERHDLTISPRVDFQLTRRNKRRGTGIHGDSGGTGAEYRPLPGIVDCLERGHGAVAAQDGFVGFG